MEFIELHGPRVSLVKLHEQGLADMHAYSLNPLLYTYLEFPPHKTLDDTRRYLQKLIARSAHPAAHYWFIQLRPTEKIIGSFGLQHVDSRKGSAEIGYGVSPDYGGMGYFNEALCLVLDHLFKDLGFHRIAAITQSDNTPSIRGLKKVGFVHEGTMRDYYLSEVDGVRRDAYIMGLLAHEYQPTTQTSHYPVGS